MGVSGQKLVAGFTKSALTFIIPQRNDSHEVDSEQQGFGRSRDIGQVSADIDDCLLYSRCVKHSHQGIHVVQERLPESEDLDRRGM